MARTVTMAHNLTIGMDAPVTAWDGKDAGSTRKAHKRVVSAQVTAAHFGIDLTDTLPCIHCGRDFDWISDGDCDRVTPTKGYVIGNVIMICRECNETRGNVLQENGSDLNGVSRYADDVILATRTVAYAGFISATNAVALIKTLDNGFIRRQRKGGYAWMPNLMLSPYWNA